MKKTVALLLALVMVLALCACGQSAAPAASNGNHFDKLTLEFVPSKDADVIIAGTANLPELVKAEMANLGYDIDEVDITVGTSYDATGEAMAAGSIDLGWLPAGTYILYSDDVDVILTATRNGLSQRPVQRQREPRRLERRSQCHPEERPPGHLLPRPDLRHPLRVRQEAGREGQQRRAAHLGRCQWRQVGRSEDLFLRRLHLPHHVADGKL